MLGHEWKRGLQQQACQDQQVKTADRKVHILLKVLPAFPAAALDSEDSLKHRDAAFDTCPKTTELSVDPTGAHHLMKSQLI